jgi:5,10-methylenetetrahydromethanopterin reductase
MAGERLPHDGGVMHTAWIRRPVPILMAAEGPRSTTLAARVADGIFLGVGLTPETLATADRWIQAGLAQRSDELGELEIWHMARMTIDNDHDTAVHRLLRALASIAHHGLSNKLAEKAVPEHLIPLLDRLGREYQTSHHVEPGENPNSRLVEELGLTDYLVERFAIVGTPDECAARVLELADLGVRRILVTVTDDDPAQTIRAWHTEVTPRIQSLAAARER